MIFVSKAAAEELASQVFRRFAFCCGELLEVGHLLSGESDLHVTRVGIGRRAVNWRRNGSGY